jgi:hypothetical protein
MTFGYNSAPLDVKSVASLNDWADNLLEQVGFIRQLPNVGIRYLRIASCRY